MAAFMLVMLVPALKLNVWEPSAPLSSKTLFAARPLSAPPVVEPVTALSVPLV